MHTKTIGGLAAVVALALALVLLSGCAGSSEPRALEGASMNGTLIKEAAGDFMPFGVTVERTGDPIGVDFRGVLSEGKLRAQLLDESGNAVWHEEASAPGPFAFNVTLHPPAGRYQLGLAWDGPVNVRYGLIWKPYPVAVPRVTPLALVGGAGMLAVALGFVAYALGRRLSWRYLLWGALAWTVTVALKFAWAIPTNAPIEQALKGALPSVMAAPVFFIYIGALTGIFEVGVSYLALRYTALGRAPWGAALAFGIGFGAVEAALLGLSSLGTVLAAMVSPSMLPAGYVERIALANNLLVGVAPVWERFFVVWIHVLSSVLLFHAVAVRQPRWFWLAFAYKTAVDTVAAAGQGLMASSLVGMWMIEGLVALFGLAGWLGTRWLRERFGAPAPAPAART